MLPVVAQPIVSFREGISLVEILNEHKIALTAVHLRVHDDTLVD